MRAILILPLALWLVGCVRSSVVYLPDGTAGYQIRCHGSLNSMSDCYNQAHANCGGPFHVVGGQEGQEVVYNIANGQPMLRTRREITVVCSRQ